MNSNSTALHKYIAHSMWTVQGYLNSQDSKLIAALLAYQNEVGVKGNLCEIGVHHGRLFLMLALARRHGERALAIDLFEDDAINKSTQHAGRPRALFANADRFGIKLLEEEIFKTSSLAINGSDILKRTRGPIRFFSIDGCHLYSPVENDLRLAEATLTSDGIIAVDDFFNREWADTSFATYDFLRGSGSFVPFALTSKLYLASPDSSEKYGETLNKLYVGKIHEVQFLGKKVLTFRESAVRKGLDRLRDFALRYAF